MTEGLWIDFLHALEDAQDRSHDAPYPTSDVAEIACDEHRMACADSAKQGRAFLEEVRRRLREHTASMNEAASAYDAVQD